MAIDFPEFASRTAYLHIEDLCWFYEDFNFSALYAIDAVPETVFKLWNSPMSKEAFMAMIYQFVEKFRQFRYVLTYRKSDWLNVVQPKYRNQLLAEICDRYISRLTTDVQISYMEYIYGGICKDNSKSNYLKFFTTSVTYDKFHGNLLDAMRRVELNCEVLILTLMEGPEIDILPQETFISTPLTEDFPDGRFKENSPVHERFNVLKASKQNLLTEINEYLLELEFIHQGLYNPQATKKVAKTQISKGLMTIFKIVQNAYPMLEKINSIVKFSCKLHLSNLEVLKINKLDESDYHKYNDSLQSIKEAASLIEKQLSSLLGLTVYADDPLERHRKHVDSFYFLIWRHHDIFSTFNTIAKEITQVYKTYNLICGDDLRQTGYSLFENHMGNLSTQLNYIIEFLSSHGISIQNPNMTKIIKNDILSLELYSRFQDLFKIATTIKGNHLYFEDKVITSQLRKEMGLKENK